MYLEISCFVSCLCGWTLVCSTLPVENWRINDMNNVALTTPILYSNLWRDCVSDMTGVSDCKDYPSMLGLPAYLHACRALTVCSVITGFFASVLTLIGMKCTKIGGSDIANARVTFAGGVTYLVSGSCGMITFSWWSSKIVTEYMDPNFVAVKFELGVGVYIGFGGSILLIGGGTVLSYLSGREGLHTMPRRPASYATARTRRTYILPGSSSRVIQVPPLFYEGRSSKTTKTTTKTSRDDFV